MKKRMSIAVASLGYRHFLFFTVSSLTSRLFMSLCAQCNTHASTRQVKDWCALAKR